MPATINITIFHDADGHIQAVFKDPAPATPAGLTALAKTVSSMSEVYGKRVKIADNSLIDRDYLELTPPGSSVLETSIVAQLAVKKLNGEDDTDMNDPSDNDDLLADLRDIYNKQSDLGFLRNDQKKLVEGAASFEIGTAAVAGKEFLTVYNPKLALLQILVEYEA
jgi:hypothetical protein